ncbi:anti-sigma factor [Streptomyces fradiae]|uniref:hypothetical protein n=1 Tax=Streptomyces fradiae TaxID=1906 RepID=UPI00294217AE|nr:hypothetical protein [Streptomyces fradiae]WOI63522.1 hypothetical protein RYQ63_28625 [Streptomyces fradiae]
MTSTADTTQHPDVSEIADLAEGILPPARTVDVRRHLDRCDLCADVRASLEEIRGLLGTLPGPPRMPVDVAERIDAALAAEALLHATAPDDTDAVSRETAHPATPPAPRVRAAERPPTAPVGQKTRPPGPGRVPARRRRRYAVLSTACGLAAVGLGLVFLQGADPAGDRPSTTRVAGEPGVEGARFSGTELTEKVRILLVSAEQSRTATTPRMRSEGAVESEEAPNRLLDETAGPQVPECVQRGIGRGEQPLAVERGEYRGRSSYLVVLPHPGTGTRVDVYIVDTLCTTAQGSPPGEVLLKHSQPRP